MGAPLKILFASAEVVPFAKTGGLADVAGALPKVLAAMGHDVRIVMPRYRAVDARQFGLRPLADPFRIPHGHEWIEIAIDESDAIDGVPTYFIDNDYLYDRDSLYGQPDDDHRFVAYSRGLLEMCARIGWTPDVINCNDWHTGLVPVYLKTIYADHPQLGQVASLFTIHNLAYQGIFPPQVMELAGLPWDLFTWDKLAFWNQFNFMKAGLVYADTLSTVSETYAREIQTPEYGEGLQGVLAYRRDDLFGILNGIDYGIWNPRTDACIPAHYTADSLAGKAACKQALQEAAGLAVDPKVPVFGMITRLSAQKGLDLLEVALPKLLKGQAMQLVVLGTGDAPYHEMLEALAKKYPKKLSVFLKFDNTLAHRIYAGSDAFLMPSHYEPCGLGQMISLAYGTLPVVRATGGLADTVHAFSATTAAGNGFVFTEYTPDALQRAVMRALKLYAEPDLWAKAVANAFNSDFSWEQSAQKYIKVYERALNKARKTSGKHEVPTAV